MKLKNKNIIITGASGGIASVVIKKLYSEGANLFLLDLNQDALISIANNYEENRIFYKSFDVSSIEDVKATFEFIKTKFSSIDALINAAGIQAPINMFKDCDLEKWKKNIEVNLLGTVYMTYHVVNLMILNNRGKIINFSGGGSTSPRNAFSAYAVAKTGVVRFTETIAEELKQYNIDVNAIAPGAINTAMLDEVLKLGENVGKEYYDSLKRKEKGGDDPNIAAELITFLCSDESNGITGKLISAPWDKWTQESFLYELRTDKDIATLRRIDNKYFQRKT